MALQHPPTQLFSTHTVSLAENAKLKLEGRSGPLHEDDVDRARPSAALSQMGSCVIIQDDARLSWRSFVCLPRLARLRRALCGRVAAF